MWLQHARKRTVYKYGMCVRTQQMQQAQVRMRCSRPGLENLTDRIRKNSKFMNLGTVVLHGGPGAVQPRHEAKRAGVCGSQMSQVSN